MEHDWEENFDTDEDGTRAWYRCVRCQQRAPGIRERGGDWEPDEEEIEPCPGR